MCHPGCQKLGGKDERTRAPLPHIPGVRHRRRFQPNPLQLHCPSSAPFVTTWNFEKWNPRPPRSGLKPLPWPRLFPWGAPQELPESCHHPAPTRLPPAALGGHSTDTQAAGRSGDCMATLALRPSSALGRRVCPGLRRGDGWRQRWSRPSSPEHRTRGNPAITLFFP